MSTATVNSSAPHLRKYGDSQAFYEAGRKLLHAGYRLKYSQAAGSPAQLLARDGVAHQILDRADQVIAWAAQMDRLAGGKPTAEQVEALVEFLNYAKLDMR